MVTTLALPQRHVPATTTTEDRTYTDLTRLLNRLTTSILSAEGILALQKSEFERAKASANVETARNLLIHLEHQNVRADKNSAKGVRKAHGVGRSDLQEKRAILKKLQDCLFDLKHRDADDAYTSDTASIQSSSSYEDDEDLMARYAPAHSNVQSGIDQQHRYANPISAQQAQSAMAAASLASAVRHRAANATEAPAAATAASTSYSKDGESRPGHSIGTTVPFAPKPDALKTHAQLLEAHDSQQQQITTDLLTLASSLKLSSKNFSDSLAASDDVVDRAVQNLDKNVTGMETASDKMNLLRRATSGWNYFNKMSLYARIAVLWVAIILLTFVAPKLRF